MCVELWFEVEVEALKQHPAANPGVPLGACKGTVLCFVGFM